MMEVANNLAVDTKYATGQGLRPISAPDEVQTHKIIKSMSVQVTDATAAGTEIFSTPIDTKLDNITKELAGVFEFYAIEDLKLTINSSSPLGTSSGALQIGWIADPYNLAFGDNLSINLQKAIRQYGSVMVRPRESLTIPIPISGKKYCLPGKEPRLSTFGGIFAVVRVGPESGDQFSVQITLECTYKFSRMCMYQEAIEPSVLTHMKVSLNTPKEIEGKMCVQLPTVVQTKESYLRMDHSLIASYQVGNVNRIVKFHDLKLRLIDPAIGKHEVVYNKTKYNNLKFLEQCINTGNWSYHSLNTLSKRVLE